MHQKPFPVIDMIATGKNIMRLREERGMTVRDLQRFFELASLFSSHKRSKGHGALLRVCAYVRKCVFVQCPIKYRVK